MSESKHVYLTLDGLRGIAAIAVVSFHTDNAFGGFILPHAYLAVDMFFVMSGIVLAHAYERRFAEGMTAGEFMRIRLIRLYPLYLLGTFIAIAGIVVALMAGVPLAGWTPTKLALAAVPAIAMLPSYAATIPAVYPLNSPSWSLLFELIANFLYALLFPLLSNRVLLAVMGVAAVGLLLTSSTGLDGGPNWESLYAGFPRVFWSFPLGVLLYRIKDRLPKPAVPPLLLAVVTIAIFMVRLPSWLVPAWDLVAVCALLPAICIAAIANEPARGAKVFLWLGAISYPIYVLHSGLYRIYERLFEIASRHPIEDFAPWPGILFFVVAAIAATVVDRAFDRPVRRLLNKRLLFRPKVVAAE